MTQTPQPWPRILNRGGFGKLPLLPEFVRVRATTSAAEAMDKWVQEGLYHAQHDLKQQWVPYYDANLFHRFVFRPAAGPITLVGVARAAMDSHGRRHPIVVFTEMPTQPLDVNPLLVTRIAEDLFGAEEQRILQIAGLSDVNLIKQHLRAPLEMPWPDVNHDSRYQTFLDEVQIGELMGPAGEPGEMVLTQLIGYLKSFAGKPEGATHCVEVPLNQPPFARSLEVRFWVELCLILLRWYPARLSLFWRTGAAPGKPASVILCFRHPPSYIWPGLLRAEGTARGVLRPWQPTAIGLSHDRRLGLRADHALRDLLGFVCRGYPQVCPWNRQP